MGLLDYRLTHGKYRLSMSPRQFAAGVLAPLRRYSMIREERRLIKDTETTAVFNLDAHVSVIADIAQSFSTRSETLHSWSISGHNRVFRRVYSGPDPVEVVNHRTWRQIDESMIERFQSRYAKMLSAVNGFISCYPPTFSQLYRGFDKPQLVVAATRYEDPYSHSMGSWRSFDAYLQSEVDAGRMLLAANNAGDRDYILEHTGISPMLVPSVCEYTEARWAPTPSSPRVVLSRSSPLSQEIVRKSRGGWQPEQKVFGSAYTWPDFFRVREYFVVPYNISTMTLFELATAGVPVSVPSKQLMLSWIQAGVEGVLTELSYPQIRKTVPPSSEPCDNYQSLGFYTWWLDRADFYNTELMPNVRTVESIEELIEEPHPYSRLAVAEVLANTESRNSRLKQGRDDLVARFCDML